jgi:hypothetical protein
VDFFVGPETPGPDGFSLLEAVIEERRSGW